MKQLNRIPLLKDHHNHISFYGMLQDCLNLQNVPSKALALEKLEQLNKENVSVVLGWNTAYYDFTQEELSSLPPVIIVNLSLHRFVMNPVAEEILKPLYPDIISNYTNYRWYEDHMPQMLIFLANRVKPSLEKFHCFFDFLAKQGIYYAEEMLLANDQIFQFLTSPSLSHRTLVWADLETFKTLPNSTRNLIKGIKLFTDGAVGARTAALKRPFKCGSRGYLFFPDEAFFKLLASIADYGKPLAIHAIGELATAQVVQAIDRLNSLNIHFPLVRLEHCQFISQSIAKLAKKLGIILSMQPNFSHDSFVYRDRLPNLYQERNNPFRMLIDKAGFVPGEDLIFGSDGMPHGARQALRAALFPPMKGQRLTLAEFMAGYCMPDTSTGSIEFSSDDLPGNPDPVSILSINQG